MGEGADGGGRQKERGRNMAVEVRGGMDALVDAWTVDIYNLP